MDLKEYKKVLRKEKIRARESIAEADRVSYSAEICRRITETPEYAVAQTIFIYKWVRGEVRLDELETAAASDGKRLVYPLCISKTEMIAVEPGSHLAEKGLPEDAAWKTTGSFGIVEPAIEHGRVTPPEAIDLVVAPCASFDEEGRRLGMGGGYYDRYLPLCIKAAKIAVAFEAQKAPEIPTDRFDFPVDAVITEASRYTVKGKQHIKTEI